MPIALPHTRRGYDFGLRYTPVRKGRFSYRGVLLSDLIESALTNGADAARDLAAALPLSGHPATLRSAAYVALLGVSLDIPDTLEGVWDRRARNKLR